MIYQLGFLFTYKYLSIQMTDVGGDKVGWKYNIFSLESRCLFPGDVVQKASKVMTKTASSLEAEALYASTWGTAKSVFMLLGFMPTSAVSPLSLQVLSQPTMDQNYFFKKITSTPNIHRWFYSCFCLTNSVSESFWY